MHLFAFHQPLSPMIFITSTKLLLAVSGGMSFMIHFEGNIMSVKHCYIHYSVYSCQGLCLYCMNYSSWHMKKQNNLFEIAVCHLRDSSIWRGVIPMKQSITYVFATMTVIW